MTTSSGTSSSLRTPLSRVRGLGTARSGTEHFWRQRLTGLANVPLTIALVVIVLKLIGKPYPEAIALLSQPLVELVLLATVISAAVHMRLGMQVIIEDYVHAEGLKLIALLANTFFAFVIGLAGVCAILTFGVARLLS